VGFKIFLPAQTGPEAHPSSYTRGTGSLLRVKRPRRGLDHPPNLARRLKKEYRYPLLPLWTFMACSLRLPLHLLRSATLTFWSRNFTFKF